MLILNFRKSAQIIAVSLLIAAPGASPAFAQGPGAFAQLAGSWHGSGQVRLADGKSERLSCRGYYNQKSGGSELTLAIRCQSDNNKIEMRSRLSHQGGHINGHWEERNFNAEGTISGSATANKLSLKIAGQVQGSMTVSVSGSSHQVAISTAGAGFKGVSISFTRG